MLRALVTLVLLAGCRQLLGLDDPTRAMAADAAANTPDAADAASSTCLDRWHSGTIRFGVPQALTELDISPTQRDPFLTPDERTIYFNAYSLGTTHIYNATRVTLADPFSGIAVVESLDSGSGESKLTMTSDGLDAVFSSGRSGGVGGADLWEAIRANTTMMFSQVDETNLVNVDSSLDEFDPELSPDGLKLYFAPLEPPQEIDLATRSSLGTKFGKPARIAELYSGSGEADPAPSFDDTIIVFTSSRTATAVQGTNLWYATRATPSDTFGTPQLVPDVNSDFDDGDAWLSEDGCRLYFSRDTTIGTQSYDLYVATAQ